MLNIFYRENGKIGVSQSEKDFAKITLENTVWIDLVESFRCGKARRREFPRDGNPEPCASGGNRKLLPVFRDG